MRLFSKRNKINLTEIEPNKLSCLCGNNEFITYGNHITGINIIFCSICNRKTLINKIGNYYNIVKLLSAYGEDFCNVIGNIHKGKCIIKELIFTEFNTIKKIEN